MFTLLLASFLNVAQGSEHVKALMLSLAIARSSPASRFTLVSSVCSESLIFHKFEYTCAHLGILESSIHDRQEKALLVLFGGLGQWALGSLQNELISGRSQILAGSHNSPSVHFNWLQDKFREGWIQGQKRDDWSIWDFIIVHTRDA